MTGDVEKLRAPIAELAAAMRDAGKAAPIIIPLTAIELDDVGRAAAQLQALAAAGANGINHTARYADLAEFEAMAARLLEARHRAGL